MEQPVSLPIRSIQHVGIPVTNLAVSEAFYSKLGFRKVMEADFDHEGEKGTCIMMRQGAILMELYEMPAAARKEIAARKDGHIDHIAFDVEDVEAVFKTLTEAGYKVQESAPVFLQFWDKGTRFFFILGPDNERIEFNQVL